MFNLCLCNATTLWYFLLKFGYLHVGGKGYKYFSPCCFKCNSFGCIAAIRCGNACHRPHSDSVYSGSEHHQFNSPRLVKCEACFHKSRGQHGAHLGPVEPRWAPCWPHEPCYQGKFCLCHCDVLPNCIYGWCHYYSDVETPDKYKCD